MKRSDSPRTPRVLHDDNDEDDECACNSEQFSSQESIKLKHGVGCGEVSSGVRGMVCLLTARFLAPCSSLHTK